MKKKLLVVYAGKFGYHVVSYFLCKYAAAEYDVSYLGLILDATGPSMSLPGVEIAERAFRPGWRGRLPLLKALAGEIEARNPDVVFAQCIPGLSLLKRRLRGRKIIIDIRSGGLSGRRWKRVLFNRLRRYEARRFGGRITINSLLLARALGFREGEAVELPLGAEPAFLGEKTFATMRLIYVGTLSRRRLEITVDGIAEYVKAHPDGSLESYTIVGSGSEKEVEAVRGAIRRHGLEGLVKMTGYVPRDRVRDLLAEANIGVSFVPMTPYYEMQPVTKTLEYCLAGMPQIATATTQNRRILDAGNGLLVEDTAASFAAGLAEMAARRSSFDSRRIYESSLKHSWENVIRRHYLPYIEGVLGS